jgi:hypothetical protein
MLPVSSCPLHSPSFSTIPEKPFLTYNTNFAVFYDICTYFALARSFLHSPKNSSFWRLMPGRFYILSYFWLYFSVSGLEIVTFLLGDNEHRRPYLAASMWSGVGGREKNHGRFFQISSLWPCHPLLIEISHMCKEVSTEMIIVALFIMGKVLSEEDWLSQSQ